MKINLQSKVVPAIQGYFLYETKLSRRHFCFVSSLLFFFSWLVSLQLGLFVLYVILALWPPALSTPAPRFAFCLCFIRFVLVVHSCFSGEPTQNLGRGLVDRKLVQVPVPKWLLCFRCGAWLCFVNHVRYRN